MVRKEERRRGGLFTNTPSTNGVCKALTYTTMPVGSTTTMPGEFSYTTLVRDRDGKLRGGSRLLHRVEIVSLFCFLLLLLQTARKLRLGKTSGKECAIFLTLMETSDYYYSSIKQKSI